jgi:cytosine/adenosine deaminase-related metal-dependent hydrolase
VALAGEIFVPPPRASAATANPDEAFVAAYAESGEVRPSLVLFRELIGLPADRVAGLVATAEHFVRADERRSSLVRGLGPHAPYSVHREVVAAAARLAAPLAMHVAESPEELELLRDGGGPFRAMLEEVGAWREGVIPAGARPLDYLKLLSLAPRSLVVHGNYLAADELAFLAERADRMALVYCPRTHAWFGHEPYPLDRALAAGVNVATGTDSRASNPDLSLLAELRHAARCHPTVRPADVLRMGTFAGAKALGRAEEWGSLASGKRADLVAVPIGNRPVRDPHELVFESDSPVIAAWRNGRLVPT